MKAEDYFVFDTETYLFNKQGKATTNIVPRLVCMSFVDDDGTPRLLERKKALEKFWSVLGEGRELVGANVSFDLGVMLRALMEEGYNPKETFELIWKSSKFDIQLAFKLADIGSGGSFSKGGYSLAGLEKTYLGVDRSDQKKGDVWRFRYNELEGVKAEDYPEAAVVYALDDARYTHQLYLTVQGSQFRNRNQVRLRSEYAYGFHLSSAWGVMVDADWTANIVSFYEEKLDSLRGGLIDAGLIDAEKGTKSRKAFQELITDAWASFSLAPKFTPKGGVATGKVIVQELEDLGYSDNRFTNWMEYQRAEKYLSTYLQPILDAIDGPLCPRFDALVDSGRSSSSGPNVQNFPARLKAEERALLATVPEGLSDIDRIAQGYVTGPDIRGCFVPRPGHVFVAADYTAAEMAGFAQVCRNLTGKLGTMAEAINNKMDLHLFVVTKLVGKSYEEVKELYKAGDKKIKRWRDVAKAVNFGGLGGGGADTLVAFARSMDLIVSRELMVQAQQAWREAFTEIDIYFRYISSREDHRGWYSMEQHGPNRQTNGWRTRLCKGSKSGSAYPQAANTLFQGLVADGALYALRLVMEDIYFNEDSPLFGARHLFFIHDENVIEVAEEKAEASGARLSELMAEGMKIFLPDLRVEAEPEVMTERWSK